jgi:Protein of unknown function (DUF4230)
MFAGSAALYGMHHPVANPQPRFRERFRVPTLLQNRPVDAAPAARSRSRRRVPKRLIAAGIGVAVAVPMVNAVGDWISGWGSPLEPEVVDRSTPALLLALDDLSEYHAATADLQVMVDLEIDTPWVPSVISGERVHVLAVGTADAYVDFEGLDDDAVTLSPDGESATIVLPAPQMSEVRIDPEESRVVDRDRGLVERLGDAFQENPTDDSALYELAERRLADAAAQSDVLERAEANTRDMLTTLAMSLGVESVTVDFEEPAG